MIRLFFHTRAIDRRVGSAKVGEFTVVLTFTVNKATRRLKDTSNDGWTPRHRGRHHDRVEYTLVDDVHEAAFFPLSQTNVSACHSLRVDSAVSCVLLRWYTSSLRG
jgi:hypothetical protein